MRKKGAPWRESRVCGLFFSFQKTFFILYSILVSFFLSYTCSSFLSLIDCCQLYGNENTSVLLDPI